MSRLLRVPRPSARHVVGAAVVTIVLAAFAPTPAMAQTWEAGVEQRAATPGETVTGVDPFEMIAVSWTGSAELPPPVDVHDAAGWSPIGRDTPGPDAGPDDRTREARTDVDSVSFSEPVWVGSADGYRVAAAPGIGHVTVHLIRQEQVLTPAVRSDAAGAAPASPDGPPVNLRSAWGAAPAKEANGVARSVKFAVIHHTAGTNDYTQADVPAILRGIQSFHQNSRGWNDIAYNFLIDKWGGIWEGRSGGIGKAIIGSHAANFNTGTVGISLLGDFTTTDPTPEALSAAANVAGWKLALAGVNPLGTTTVVGTDDNVFPTGQSITLPTIVGHRDIGQTDCPGRVWDHLADIRTAAAQRAAYVTGNLETIEQTGPDRVHVKGWAFDRRTSDPLHVVVDVNGRAVADSVTSVARPDVRGVHPGASATSGFDTTITATADVSDVCVYAAETSYGALTKLGCRSFNTPTNPRGNYEALVPTATGATATGWALDPNTSDPIEVQLYVDGAKALTTTASGNRPDVGAVYPSAGAAHGWTVDVPLTPNVRHEVCAFAINVGAGTVNTLLGCRAVGADPVPTGSVQAALVAGDQAVALGWALDRDGPTAVLFFVNGRMAKLAPANLTWPNLTGAFPGYGIDHGFFTAFPIPKGSSNICAFALNVGPGPTATSLGCRVLKR
ncbi:MAG: peptidoglycan recognition protein [Acidimicrobiales bacterium]